MFVFLDSTFSKNILDTLGSLTVAANLPNVSFALLIILHEEIMLFAFPNQA